MTQTELDQLALDVCDETDAFLGLTNRISLTKLEPGDWIKEFARRYRAALVEKMEPIAWMVHYGEIWNTPKSPYKSDIGFALYSLEDW